MTNDPASAYHRRERTARLSFSTNLFQGIGAIPDTIKNWTFKTFILLFYNQVLGVDAFLVSIALAVAVVVDAMTDPLVASLSDNLGTRWGRRHPLMLLGSVPLGMQVLLVHAGWDGTFAAVVWAHLVFVLPYLFLSLAGSVARVRRAPHAGGGKPRRLALAHVRAHQAATAGAAAADRRRRRFRRQRRPVPRHAVRRRGARGHAHDRGGDAGVGGRPARDRRVRFPAGTAAGGRTWQRYGFRRRCSRTGAAWRGWARPTHEPEG